MEYALGLVKAEKEKTSTISVISAIVVHNEEIVGFGIAQQHPYTDAEIQAIKRAKERARGASLYVTLESGNFMEKDFSYINEICNAGIARIFYALENPDPMVKGKSIGYLINRNIDVHIGLLEKSAREIYEEYFWTIQRKRPWVALKLAMTLDGRIADNDGHSKWITNNEARQYVHALRRKYAAIAVGRSTVNKDNSRLTVRLVEGKSPVRIVFGNDKHVHKKIYFKQNPDSIRSIVVSRGGKKGMRTVTQDNVEIWYTGYKKDPESLKSFLDMAFEQGLNTIFIEGGQRLASSFLEYQLVNRLYLFFGNKILGKGICSIDMTKGFSLNQSITLNDIKFSIFDDNFFVTGIPCWGNE